MVGLQILYPQGKENLVIKSTLIGAIVNFTFNCALIPFFAQYGAAIATCIAELSVTTTMLIIGKQYIPYKVICKTNFFILLFSVLVCVPILFINKLEWSVFILLPIEIAVSALLYGFFLWKSKNELLEMALTTIKNKL